MIYLRPRQYYEDDYDKDTISTCKKHIERFNKDPILKALSEMFLYFIKGERFIEREKYIQSRIDNDTQCDSLINNFEPPYVFCFSCNDPMDYVDHMLDFDISKLGIQYYMKCTRCKVHSKFDSKGREDVIPWQCPSCKAKLVTKVTRKKSLIITKENCNECGYKKSHTLDLDDLGSRTPIEEFDEQKFLEDRLRFCLSKKEGEEYIEGKARLESVNRLMKSMNDKDKPKDEDKIRVLTVKEAMKIVNQVLRDNGFENTKISDPEVKADITFKFSAIDSESRKPHIVKSLVKKLLTEKFKGTNWKLFVNGIDYKLGIIEGGVRGREVPVRQQLNLDNVIL